MASSSVSVDAIRRGARRRRHSASDDLPVFIADAGAHNPSITRHFSRAIDPTRRGAVDKEMRRHQRSNVHQVNRTAKYLRHEGMSPLVFPRVSEHNCVSQGVSLQISTWIISDPGRIQIRIWPGLRRLSAR